MGQTITDMALSIEPLTICRAAGEKARDSANRHVERDE
jgi:hypothetical protein